MDEKDFPAALLFLKDSETQFIVSYIQKPKVTEIF